MQLRPRLEPQGFFRRIPLQPHQLTEPVTPVKDTIVLCHLGVANVAGNDWTLTVDGLVERPLQLTLDGIGHFPFVEIQSVHQCAGSPLQPRVPTRRVANVVWGGIRLADVLRAAKVKPEARFLWSYGADWGTFEGVETDAYQKDLAVERIADDVLIAFEMNGAPLRPEHGFPARLVVPGFFGTNSTKWLTRLTLAETRADGPFVTRWYNDPVLDAQGNETGRTKPVWSLHPEALIVRPGPKAALARGTSVQISGWAWSEQDIARVEISTDGGTSWFRANVGPRRQRSWQSFSRTWFPEGPGPTTLLVRATDEAGATQPAAGWRNAIHAVEVTVT